MATKILINGRLESRAGVYSLIKSGVKNPPANQPVGNVLIIDDGIGAGFGGGSGINGTLKNGVDAVYSFDSMQEFQSFVKGGELFNIAEPLFKPSNTQKGISKLYFAQARQTTPARVAMTLANGSFAIRTKDEGVNANGVLTSGNLSSGIAGKLIQQNIPTSTATFITTITQAASAAVLETRATAILSVSDLGDNTDVISVEVNGIVIGSITVDGSMTTATLAATALKNAVNAGTSTHGYTAANTTAAITFSAPVGSGALNNGVSTNIRHVYTIRGFESNSSTTFTGGVTANAALPQKNTVVANNINDGDNFSVTVGGVTKTVKATSTLKTDLYTQLKALLNADPVVTAIVTASITTAGLILTSVVTAATITTTSATTPATPKFNFFAYHGTFKGNDLLNNTPYDGVAASDAVPQLLVKSPTVSTVQDLINYFLTDVDFNAGFVLEDGYTATGNLTANDHIVYSNYTLATGGTESYNNADINSVLEVINNLDFTHILSTHYGLNAVGVKNAMQFDFVANQSKYDRLIVMGGGFDKSTFKTNAGSSEAIAKFFDNDKAIVIHGGVKKSSRIVRGGFKICSQLYHAAAVLGRCAGLPSQVPVTIKSIGIDGAVHSLTDAEQTYALSVGVTYSYFDTELNGGTWVVGQGITSLQKNDYLLNEDSTTFNWQLKRIIAEINKTIVINGKQRFFDPEGLSGNRTETSEEEVTNWAKVQLQKFVDNQLIISYKDVSASITQDIVNLEYKFIPNTEVSKILSTGVIIEG